MAMATCSIVRIFKVAISIQLWSSLVVAQFGMGIGGMGMGGMGGFGGFGRNINRYFGPNSLLARAVRQIVHPNAVPTQEMINIATRHQGPPADMAMFMEYAPHMIQQAYQLGVKPNGTSGTPSYEVMQKYIMDRGIKWVESRGFFVPSTTAANVSTNGSSSNQIESAVSGSTASAGQTGSVAPARNVGQSASAPRPVTTSAPFAYQYPTTNPFYDNIIMMQLLGQNEMDLQGLF